MERTSLVMIIFKENKDTGLQCGLNDFGDLFLGDDKSGYNLPDTKGNRECIIADFDYYNKSYSDYIQEDEIRFSKIEVLL